MKVSALTDPLSQHDSDEDVEIQAYEVTVKTSGV
jgi:hypothetical protein